MRKLAFVVRSRRGALPLIVAASVVPAGGACGSKSGLLEPGVTSDAGSDAGAGAGGGGAGGSGGTFVLDAGGSGGSGGTGAESCGGGPAIEETYVVPLPAEGVPAEPGQICSVSVEPVESGLAAHVTLEKLGEGADLSQASGLCAIDAALEPRVIGEPVIEVIDASHAALLQMSVSGLTKVPGGWSFSASFPAPLELQADGWARMTVRTAFELDCSPEPATRVVHAATDIHVCLEDGQLDWASSGESCTVCRIIAEMAPSPIVPEPKPDDLPLARALKLRIVELARVSNTLVLWAENDGGDEVEYEWHASGGRVRRLAPDVVAWTLEEGMPAPFIQAAVSGPGALAVASFGFNEAA